MAIVLPCYIFIWPDDLLDTTEEIKSYLKNINCSGSNSVYKLEIDCYFLYDLNQICQDHNLTYQHIDIKEQQEILPILDT